jgi:hypothetical protein
MSKSNTLVNSMGSAGKQFGKQQPKPAELGTENRRTQDVKPRTRNTKLETSDPRGPNNPLRRIHLLSLVAVLFQGFLV